MPNVDITLKEAHNILANDIEVSLTLYQVCLCDCSFDFNVLIALSSCVVCIQYRVSYLVLSRCNSFMISCASVSDVSDNFYLHFRYRLSKLINGYVSYILGKD